MGRGILEIAQEAAGRDATAPQPTSLFGASAQDRIARVLRTAAHDVLRDYLRQSRWEGMSEFQSTWVFALQPGRYAYQMPPDFLRIVPGTEQRAGWPMGLVGPATPQVWAWWIYGGSANVAPHGWRIKNNALWIDPTPTASELVTIEYITRYPVVSAIKAGDFNLATKPLQTIAPVVPRDGWIKSADVSLTDDNGAGVGHWDELPGWDDALWGSDPEEILKRLNPMSTTEPLPEVRRATFEADTDRPAFEDDHLLSLGMTWHLQRALGLPYAERAAEYETEMAVKVAEDAGGARPFKLGSCDETWDTWPLENGRWMVT